MLIKKLTIENLISTVVCCDNVYTGFVINIINARAKLLKYELLTIFFRMYLPFCFVLYFIIMRGKLRHDFLKIWFVDFWVT